MADIVSKDVGINVRCNLQVVAAAAAAFKSKPRIKHFFNLLFYVIDEVMEKPHFT